MNVLFVGDIVGPEAAAWLAGRVPDLRKEHDVDLAIVNAENIRIDYSTGTVTSGMTAAAVGHLFDAGVDVITSGNHAWDGPDAEALLADPRVVRPLNVPKEWGGKGLLTLDVDSETVTVVNLTDKEAIPEASPLNGAWDPLPEHGTVIVDVHSGPHSKYGFAFAQDGKVAAVLGTHTHEPTSRLHLLPGGTALVVEVGMTGPSGGCGGFDPGPVMAMYKGEDATSVPFGFACGPLVLGAVLLRIENGKTVQISRLD
jgi:2',3'-cyclic-nucleotide 2'-phosphodiesterase